jgi:hypothetical protein
VDDVPRHRAVARDEPAVQLVAPHLVVPDREERDRQVREKDEAGKEAVVAAGHRGARVRQPRMGYASSMTRRTVLSLLVVVAAVGLVGCTKSADLKALSVDEVAARVTAHDGKTFIYDNNPKDRFTKSHVPGAKWLDYDNVTAADLPADKTATLVFYCASEL